MNFSPEFANHLSILASRFDCGLNTFSTLPVSDSIHHFRQSITSDVVKVFAVFGKDVLDLAMLDNEFRVIFDPNDIGVGDPHQYLGTYSDIYCFFSCHANSRAFSLLSLDIHDKNTWSSDKPELRLVDVKTFVLK